MHRMKFEINGSGGSRTPGLLLAEQTLSQLSYRPDLNRKRPAQHSIP